MPAVKGFSGDVNKLACGSSEPQEPHIYLLCIRRRHLRWICSMWRGYGAPFATRNFSKLFLSSQLAKLFRETSPSTTPVRSRMTPSWFQQDHVFQRYFLVTRTCCGEPQNSTVTHPCAESGPCGWDLLLVTPTGTFWWNPRWCACERERVVSFPSC